jgi:hypothetical protein
MDGKTIMLLYTIISPEFIFEETDSQTENGEPEVEIKRGSLSLMVQPLPSGQARVTRIISTDAQDYLNPQWQPGSIMSIS